jgi:predicted acetyltransferase
MPDRNPTALKHKATGYILFKLYEKRTKVVIRELFLLQIYNFQEITLWSRLCDHR